MTPNPRRLWGLVAVGAATAVGITTHDAGFTVLTLFGSLLLPRFLGFGGHRHGMHSGPCGGHQAGRTRLEERMTEWHRQAHGDAPTAPAAPPGAAPVA